MRLRHQLIEKWIKVLLRGHLPFLVIKVEGKLRGIYHHVSHNKKQQIWFYCILHHHFAILMDQLGLIRLHNENANATSIFWVSNANKTILTQFYQVYIVISKRFGIECFFVLSFDTMVFHKCHQEFQIDIK